MNQALVVGLLRHALQLLAGVLVTRGYLDSSMADATVGAAVTLGTAGWYVADRVRKR